MAVLATSLPELSQKPLLRGWSHLVAFGVALVAGAVLIASARSREAALAASVYAFSLSALFGTSALYHRPNWAPRARAWMRRLDHSAIFLLIAGTYTPFSLTLGGERASLLLALAWGAAALGCLRALFWVDAPKPLSAAIYVATGWIAVAFGPELFGALGGSGLFWLVLGGVLYSVGAVVYALRRPNPWPRVFGYHEIFHLLVILAAACHFGVVASILG